MPLPEGGTERNIVDTVRWTQQRLLAGDDRVVILGEDVGPRGGVFRATDDLAEEFGQARVLDTPLAESSIIGIGIGLALAGLRPIAEIQFADFIHSGFDQLVSEAARIHYRSNGDFSVPLVVRAPWGGGVHGALYHSQSIEATYAHIPGLKVVAPVHARRRLRDAPRGHRGRRPGALPRAQEDLPAHHRASSPTTTPGGCRSAWPRWPARATTSPSSPTASTATCASRRPRRWPRATACRWRSIDLRTISPLDRDTVLASVAKTGRCLVVHEDNISFGVGAEVAAIVAAGGVLGPRRAGAPARHRRRAELPVRRRRSRPSCSSTPPRSSTPCRAQPRATDSTASPLSPRRGSRGRAR